ncbi:hypothetical protein ACEUZ9_000864 [Paracoccus litorisediminis]|uniref:hypothetical protein n=1 Tax=Paracoccus litorisediminis TaxID=2006130 RepID=UPI0037327675
MERIITKEFFKPVAAAVEKGETNIFSLFLNRCDLVAPVLTAMKRARDAGEFGHIEGIAGNGFEEGAAWNRFCAGEAVTPIDIHRMSSLLVDPMIDIVAKIFTRHAASSVSRLDADGLNRDFSPLALKLDRFLAHPKMHAKDRTLPRNTRFCDRTKTDRFGTCYLLRLDGWSGPVAMERPAGEGWRLCRNEPEHMQDMEP